jgi:DNA-directed RNA polymerase subunit RPC12/RpoP
MTKTIDDYPEARIYTSSKCPTCHQWIEDLPSHLPTIADMTSAPLTCPYCDERLEVRCLVTVDCFAVPEGEQWFIGVGKRRGGKR